MRQWNTYSRKISHQIKLKVSSIFITIIRSSNTAANLLKDKKCFLIYHFNCNAQVNKAKKQTNKKQNKAKKQ